MRVLVVGSYPPAVSATAEENLAIVTDLVAAGHHVEVLSPAPSAAHHSAELHRLWGPLLLARRARRFDAVVLRCEVAIVFPPRSGRLGRVARCIGFGLALRAGPPATVHLGAMNTPASVAVRSGRLLWRHADRLVVASEADRLGIAQQGPFPLARIDVQPPAPKPRPPRHAPAGDPRRALVVDSIRAEAAADRVAEKERDAATS
ncbi:MAG: hypothetical protein ABIS21_02010 [Acidimicrobiales bacterium]